MIRCIIEYIPFGDFTHKEQLATMTISKTNPGHPDIGEYAVHLIEKGKTFKGRVENHPRLQHGPAFLVAKAIEACSRGEES